MGSICFHNSEGCACSTEAGGAQVLTVLHVSTHYIMFELWRDLLTVVAGLSVLIGLKASEMSAA